MFCSLKEGIQYTYQEIEVDTPDFSESRNVKGKLFSSKSKGVYEVDK